MTIRNMKRHHAKIQTLLNKYRQTHHCNSINAIIAEMRVVYANLKLEIDDIAEIDPEDQSKLEANAEYLLASIENYLNDNKDDYSIFSRVMATVGIFFLVVGALCLSISVLTIFSIIRPTIQTIKQPTNLIALGGSLLTAGATLIATFKHRKQNGQP